MVMLHIFHHTHKIWCSLYFHEGEQKGLEEHIASDPSPVVPVLAEGWGVCPGAEESASLQEEDLINPLWTAVEQTGCFKKRIQKAS